MVDVAGFYDGLAGEYDRLFDDWWTAARWHGVVVARLLAAQGVVPPAAVLDCTCGIGTQALPLAATGYAMTGTDVSARAVERAAGESSRRGLQIALEVADMRRLPSRFEGTFDAAIACDNALPHLLTDADLHAALHGIRSVLRAGGTFLASIRDYDALALERPAGVPISLHGEAGRRHGSGQAWQWSPSGEHVDINLFTLVESAGGWEASSHETTYRALPRAALTAALACNGFEQIHWLMPEESGYYQPVVVARSLPA